MTLYWPYDKETVTQEPIYNQGYSWCIFFSFLLWHFGCTVSELYEKKYFIEDPETNPDVLRGGHRNPYQLENAIKSDGTVFCLYHCAVFAIFSLGVSSMALPVVDFSRQGYKIGKVFA